MIELPEAITIARQMTEALKGKRIESAMRGNAPHKFAFYNRPPEDYAALLKGKTIGESVAHGSGIFAYAEPDYALFLGTGGERILFHQSEKTLPKKHQLLLHFEDGTYLTVTVQGWGSAMLFHRSEIAKHPYAGAQGVSPLSEAFTFEYFEGRFGEMRPDDPRNVKEFMISKPGIWGVANGCLQDILFLARIHPRRKIVTLSTAERRALYEATHEMLRQATEQGGRDTEYDLYNHLGQYKKILDARSAGQPCPRCGTAIEKISFMGGSAYFCPQCQV